MSAEPQYGNRTRPERRWTPRETAGLIAVIWVLAILLFFILTATP